MIYKNIMLAIDGSEISNAAIDEIIKRTKDQDVNLRVIHVLDEGIVYSGGPSFNYDLFRDDGVQILDDAVKTIQKQSSIKVEKSLLVLRPLQGRVAEVIVEEAKNWPADLLIIGTHGRRGFSRLFLGSVAENIVRIATTPVLLVRGSNA